MRSAAGGRAACGPVVVLFLLAAVTPSAHAEAECDDAHANENETDTGGDDCSYYAIFPAHCGCCDTPSFSAAACCACQAGSVDGNASWWTSVFLSWPRKAKTLRLPNKRIRTEFPLNIVERWPSLEEVNLYRNYLTGNLPAQLGGLSNLSKLDLSSNRLTGPLPREIGNLSQLQELTLSRNSLSGSLPRELGSLSQLQVLRLSDNSLSGSLPRELGNLSQLQELRLAENGLSGSLPRELWSLSQLQVLELSDNSLSGSLSRELGNLSQLQELRLSGNSLSGSLPRELGSLSKLQVLGLSRNSLSGSLLRELGSLSELQVLALAHNSLSGSLPMELGNLTHLVVLELYKNDFRGGLPRELGNLESLQTLDLSFNRLSGSLPPEFGQLGNLRFLFLEENELSGELPPELGKLKGLEWLYLYTNQLSGPLPHDFGNLTSLQYLVLYNNQLTGSLPRELCQLRQLQELRLNDNQFNGSLSPDFGMLTNLERLHLEGNHITGALPAGFGDLRYLWELKLNNNRLSGELPPELGNLSYLMFLDLSHNNFSGSLPPEFGRLTWLEMLRLNHNQLGGSLPVEIGLLVDLGELYLHHNRLSGHLPPGLGNLTRLRQLELQENQFSGGIPPELGRLSVLKDLLLQQNQLTGPLPPQLGGLSGLRTLRLQGNNLSSGLPASFTGLRELVNLEVAQNPLLCGDAQFLEELSSLEHLNLRGCCFNDSQLPSLPPELQHLDVGQNRLSRLPSRWQEQGLFLRTLLMDGNMISQWNTSAIVPLSKRGEGMDGWVCGFYPPGSPFAWAQLERLDVSSNPLGVHVYDFLESLSPLSQLRWLGASDCNLTGAVPLIEQEKLVPGMPHLGTPDWFCRDFPEASLRVSFPMLRNLDLSGNAIVALLSGPSAQLESVDLSRNALASLNSVWWEGETSLVSLDIRDNPALQLPVLLGLDAADTGIDVNAAVPSSCQSSGANRLTADVHGWSRRPGGTAECTSLCPMRTVVLHVDATVNESVLCRCTTGQGVGLACDPCHNDSYSDMALTSMSTPEAHYHHYRRTCLRCPPASHLRDGQGVCFTDCTCVAGYYMAQVFNGTVQEVGFTPCSRLVKAEGKCVPCGLFETSQPGSRRATDCVCNGNQAEGGWGGLLESGGQCGCAAGYHMNFKLRECELCQLEEDCGSFAQSLRPPIVKAGYWALPAPAEGSDGLFGNFSHHNIWRCESTSACPLGDACGLNRTGTACGLCKQGHFRSPSGWCQPCPRSYKATRHFLAGLFVPLMALPILAHVILTADSNARGLIMTLRSFRISLRQVVKFAQVLGLVSLFSVEWPALVSSIFAGFRFFSLDFASWMGVACLDEQQQQTMTKELVFRWMMAPAGVVVTCCAALLATLCSWVLDQAWCCRRSCHCSGSKLDSRMQRILRFSISDLIRVLIFFLHLFYPSLLGSALIPLSCSPSPNGHMTMNAFPHVVCSLSQGSDQGFLPVALVGLAQSLLLGLGFPILLVIAWKRLRISRQIHIRTTVAESEGNDDPHDLEERRRWWMFLFEDYRAHKMFWVLVSLTKDILLNFVIVLLPGLGTAQLLVTAVISGSYACLTFYVSPYQDWSNTLLETCTAGAVAGLCLFSAGLGFQFEQGVPDLGHYIAGGRDGSVYLQRTLTIGILQGLSVVGPAVIMFFQLLSPFSRCRSFIPRCFRPLSAAQREEWSQLFASAMRLDGSPMPIALAEFDDLDFCAFRQAVCSVPLVRNSLKTSLASLGRLASEGTRASANQPQDDNDNGNVPALRTEITELRRQIAALSAENEAYKEETLQLRSTIAAIQRAGSGILPLETKMSL